MNDAPATSEPPLTGTLHIYVAFDWGDEVDLERARSLAPAEFRALPRRPRTPTSIAYRPPPLKFTLPPVALPIPGDGRPPAACEVTVFDFAAVSVSFRVPFELGRGDLIAWADRLAEPEPVLKAAREAVRPLYELLLPAVRDPLWRDDLSEEYFVFQFPPEEAPVGDASRRDNWLAGMVRLESEPLSGEEVTEALRLHLRYGPSDLFVPDWAAAVLFDTEPGCRETLGVIEFANVQLLEYRHIDDTMANIYRRVREENQVKPQVWRRHDHSLRTLGEMKVEATDLFERTGNVLKLVGDQYLARVHRLLASRFHLKEWEASIARKLEVAEGVYQVIADQSTSHRTEILEIVVIVLIATEILLALFRH